MTHQPLPYVGPPKGSRIYFEVQTIETTRPGDEYRTFGQTGRRAAWILGVRVPLWCFDLAVDWYRWRRKRRSENAV